MRRPREFRRTLGRLLLLVAVLGGVAVVGSLLVGPAVLRLVFGPDFTLTNKDLALLAASSAALMAAQALGQGLIARSAYRGVVAGWLAGVVAFFVVVFADATLCCCASSSASSSAALPPPWCWPSLQPDLWRASARLEAPAV